LFAVEHLGINEACFERTVFIGQMDTKVDASGGRELVDKLANIRETGSEEVSLKKARELLRFSYKLCRNRQKHDTAPGYGELKAGRT